MIYGQLHEYFINISFVVGPLKGFTLKTNLMKVLTVNIDPLYFPGNNYSEKHQTISYN